MAISQQFILAVNSVAEVKTYGRVSTRVRASTYIHANKDKDKIGSRKLSLVAIFLSRDRDELGSRRLVINLNHRGVYGIINEGICPKSCLNWTLQ